jgi:hypothetical protein
VQAADPGLTAYEPAAQGVQLEAPAAEEDPAEQIAQPCALADPMFVTVPA